MYTLHGHAHLNRSTLSFTYLSEEIFNVQVVRQQFPSIYQSLVTYSLRENNKFRNISNLIYELIYKLVYIFKVYLKHLSHMFYSYVT